jgi:hypothetical protein
MLPLILGGAASLIGGAMSSSAARRAAEVQAAASREAAASTLQAGREANQLTADIYQSGLRQQAPYQQSGQLSLAALMQGLGLGTPRSSVTAPRPGAAMTPAGSYTNAQGQPVDSRGQVITAGANYGLGDVNYGATQEEMDAAAAGMEPGYFNRAFTTQDLMQGIDPGYQFRIDQGNAQLAARRAATGNRFGGQALKDITNYNQDAASQEYGNAYQRYMTNKQEIFNRLSGLAGVGQAVGSGNQQLGANTSSQMGSNITGAARGANEYLTGGAAAQAGGIVGSTNAIVGGINQGANNWYTQNIMDKFLDRTRGYAPRYGAGGNMPDFPVGPGPY